MAKKKPTIRQAGIVLAFAQRLRGTRLAKGMTQRDLATQAHVTFSYISRLEAGGAAPGIDLIERLAEALNVGIADLLPLPSPAMSVEKYRDQVKSLFDAVLPKAGQETLSLLELFLFRLAESQAVTR